MIEAMATIWLVSFVLSLIVTAFNVNSVRKQLRSKKLAVLNANLAKLRLYWDNSKGSTEAWAPDAVQKDAARSLRSSALVGLLGLASFPGFVFLIIIVLSMRFLSRSRTELDIFHSALATDSALSGEDVKKLLEDIRLING